MELQFRKVMGDGQNEMLNSYAFTGWLAAY